MKSLRKLKLLLGALTLTQMLVSTGHAQIRESKGKILLVVTNEATLGEGGAISGIHLNELTHPYYAFTEVGYDVEFASPKGADAPVDPPTLELVDPFNKRFQATSGLMDNRKLTIKNTLKLESVRADDYKGIYLVGGVSSMWDFPNNPDLQDLLRNLYESGAAIGAICHGSAALVNVKLSNGTFLVDGKNLTSFTNQEEAIRNRTNVVPFLLEDELKKRGALHTVSRDPFNGNIVPYRYHVVTDGNLITGQNPASAFGVAFEMIEYLKTK